ncbi:FAD-dependent oxidoreductase [Cyanobacterium stanieri LEGE 03274]|uniref:FAD-dependent oxidoreductase n=1 Tax=Cyanobacterium stanieri LEGE 03274 TaxID=1828756 RepID=A0ABR9UZU2_9CHRO|nr:FAD-dependent oxidoreductase [Cyanobacterium stanieri]MBE9221122.1 FAD-dependent oxidoreductase [Cyanobacterium stanieri LEGE 03274]
MTKLVLIGGGHSHAIALKMYYDNPIKNIEIILINEVKNTPYSGMLPAYIAGYYNFEQTHINLEKLSKKTKIKLIIDQVININPKQQKVICKSGKIIPYDYLSIDIGSPPKQSRIKGATEYSIPAKPVSTLLKEWDKIISKCHQTNQENINLNIIGAGAGGVELALNMFQKLTNLNTIKKVNITVISRNETILRNYNQLAINIVSKILKNKGIKVIFNTEIIEILPNAIITQKKEKISSDYTFLVTNPSPAPWLKNTEITLDEQGFILISNTLQSVSHKNIFATGDIATIKNYPCPKAGVFAVRQGKPLYQNWKLIVQGKNLQPYYPQSLYLSLIGTGNQKAVAIWGNLAYHSSWLWWLKDYIDKKFMKQFSI